MKISRRNFLRAVTASAGTLLSYRPTGLERPGPWPERELNCVLLDLKSHCVLRESLQGYQAALADEHSYLPEARTDSRWRCRMAIVPGVGPMDLATTGMLLDLMKSGTHVLLESGAGFLSPTEFAAHQRMLHRCFNLAVEPPVDLWSGNSGGDRLFAHRSRPHQREKLDSRECIPYVKYVWPRETTVRDFSRAIPVSANEGEVIGRVGLLPVAMKRRLENGTLIFLGSPLGPALRAGDPEARSWLQLVTALLLEHSKV
jgi:hypothetical protein